MKKYLAKFLDDTSGAVTVDWVVLTAAVVTLGLVVMISINSGVAGGLTKIEAGIAQN